MCVFFFFFFNDTATTEIYTLSLHDALPIWIRLLPARLGRLRARGQRPHGRGLRDEDSAEDGREGPRELGGAGALGDRKSTRLNSSHGYISYAVFCLKKKKNKHTCGC